MSSSSDRKKPHIAFLPSAGMGHLKPFCSLAAALSERGCDVSFITVHPAVSEAESCHVSNFFAAFPRIRRLDFDLGAFDPSGVASTDPFFLRVEAIRRSAHLLPALLAASSPGPKVDREDGEVELEGLLGERYLERVKDRGLVVKGWVDQEEILRHRAIGGFLSHCGANSVFEAAFHGVPVLGWPEGGDQRVNAEVVVRSGLGIWVKEWSWEGEEEVVMGEEIGERVRHLMEDEGLQASAARLREGAVKAVAEDGSSGKGLAEFIRML
uniref:UDP-glucose:2-hydroxyflavanone C-glucosyltransferase n=1 Tax=Elaeis guineensis var. tenera TaxID=51953 RepID=A0A6J0PKY0_ELAGV|nr:UDP-glucose:2-hydroxyflavanone C-glucosyltransferase [Elaeis guineensis]